MIAKLRDETDKLFSTVRVLSSRAYSSSITDRLVLWNQFFRGRFGSRNGEIRRTICRAVLCCNRSFPRRSLPLQLDKPPFYIYTLANLFHEFIFGSFGIFLHTPLHFYFVLKHLMNSYIIRHNQKVNSEHAQNRRVHDNKEFTVSIFKLHLLQEKYKYRLHIQKCWSLLLLVYYELTVCF